MLINKILVFLGIAIMAIILIENMIFNQIAYLLWFSSNTGVVLIVATIIGFFIGFGFRGIIDGKKSKYDESDNFDF